MKDCKNIKGKKYSGEENTPLGRGYHAKGEKIGTHMKGKDGNKYKVVKFKGGKRWQKVKKIKSPKSRKSPKAYGNRWSRTHDTDKINFCIRLGADCSKEIDRREVRNLVNKLPEQALIDFERQIARGAKFDELYEIYSKRYFDPVSNDQDSLSEDKKNLGRRLLVGSSNAPRSQSRPNRPPPLSNSPRSPGSPSRSMPRISIEDVDSVPAAPRPDNSLSMPDFG